MLGTTRREIPIWLAEIKFGDWRHLGSFADQRFASNSVSLAAPASSGAPLPLSGDVGGWAVFEQQIYRVPHSNDRGIGIFARVSGAPADRNLIDLLPTRVSSSSVSARLVRMTSSGSPRATLTSPSVRRCWTRTIGPCSTQLADAEFRRIADGGLSISDQGRLDRAAELPVHHPSGRSARPFRLGRWPGSRSETHRVLVCGRPSNLKRSIHDRRGAGCGMPSRPSGRRRRRRRATQCRGHVAAGSART